MISQSNNTECDRISSLRRAGVFSKLKTVEFEVQHSIDPTRQRVLCSSTSVSRYIWNDRTSEIKLRWLPKIPQSNGGSAWLEQTLYQCLRADEGNPLSAEEMHWRTIHQQQCEVQVSRWWLSNERGNFSGNSRPVRKLTHSIYGSYLQIAAVEQRVHATGHRINSARRECPYSSIFANMWAFCAFKCEHFTRLAELQWGQLIDENLCFGLSCFTGKDSHGNTKKLHFALKENCRRI